MLSECCVCPPLSPPSFPFYFFIFFLFSSFLSLSVKIVCLTKIVAQLSWGTVFSWLWQRAKTKVHWFWFWLIIARQMMNWFLIRRRQARYEQYECLVRADPEREEKGQSRRRRHSAPSVHHWNGSDACQSSTPLRLLLTEANIDANWAQISARCAFSLGTRKNCVRRLRHTTSSGLVCRETNYTLKGANLVDTSGLAQLSADKWA